MRSIADIFRSHCDFDENGRHRGGSDRQSNHSYGDAYERIFPDRNAIKLLWEIGTAGGEGLLAWREIFQAAHIVGMDIHPCAIGERGDRFETHVGDQRSKEDIKRVAAGRLFDFIVEDAFHSLENTLLTMFYAWPFVRPGGGVYVVEEWSNVGADRENIQWLWPGVEIVDTKGPFGGVEPLVVFRKE